MDLPLCKICGTRHRLGFCPEFGQDLVPSGPPSLAPSRAAASTSRVQPSRPEPAHEKVETKKPPAKGQSPTTREAEIAGATSGRKRGRPSEADRARSLTATKPWLNEGISERTWYRRQKKPTTR